MRVCLVLCSTRVCFVVPSGNAGGEGRSLPLPVAAHDHVHAANLIFFFSRARAPPAHCPQPLAPALSPSRRDEEGVDALIVRHAYERLLATALHLVTYCHQHVRLLPMNALCEERGECANGGWGVGRRSIGGVG